MPSESVRSNRCSEEDWAYLEAHAPLFASRIGEDWSTWRKMIRSGYLEATVFRSSGAIRGFTLCAIQQEGQVFEIAALYIAAGTPFPVSLKIWHSLRARGRELGCKKVICRTKNEQLVAAATRWGLWDTGIKTLEGEL